jgi:sugar phosphate isomerase/epimerase
MAKISIGVQVYTVRDDCKMDFKGTLSALAKMGYQGVELGGDYGGMMPEELAAFLKELRIVCCGIHMPLEHLLGATSESYQYAKVVRSPFVSTSCADEVAKDWPDTIEKLCEAGRVAQSLGLTFTYHNHSQEFRKIGGQYALDLLYQAADPATVQAELDTYWVKKGGEDPAAYIRKYAGRTPQIHLKDMDPGDGSFTEVGYGLMDLPAIFAAAEKGGVRWIIYEQDTCKRPPLESARITIENLRKARFV